LASFLRLWRLDSNPPSANWDESSIGYNAYSILKTARDDFGQHLPLSFRSNDDYKTPLYFYLDIPFIKILGLNIWAVRLPSALAGIGVVILTFILAVQLFGNRKIALLSALMIAVSPWSIHFSRGALEANLVVFLNLLATVLFLKGLKNPKYFFLSSAVFGLSLYNYLIPRYFLPLFFIGLALIYRDILWKHKKYVAASGVFFILFAFPILKDLSSPAVQVRSQGVNIFNNPTPGDRLTFFQDVSVKKMEDEHILLSQFLHNRRFYAALLVLRGYLSHFDFSYLFLPGGILVYQTPQMGLMYLVEFPLLLAGIYFLIRRKLSGRGLVFLWLLLAPLVAAPTTSTPHASRSILMLPMLQIITALGVYYLILYFKRFRTKNILIYALCGIFTLNFLYYLHQYHVHYQKEFSFYWQYGYEELNNYLNSQRPNYDKFIFMPKITEIGDHAHIFLLFLNAYDPQKYLDNGGTRLCDFGLTGRYSFDQYIFRTEVCNFKTQDQIDIFNGFRPNSLVIANPSDYRDVLGFPSPIKVIYLYNSDKSVFMIYRSNDIIDYAKRFGIYKEITQ